MAKKVMSLEVDSAINLLAHHQDVLDGVVGCRNLRGPSGVGVGEAYAHSEMTKH